MAQEARHWLSINRAPVLTLWAAVVAERLGFAWDEALTLGRAVAGLNAYSKGKALGLFSPTPAKVKEQRAKLRPKEAITVDLLHRAVPALHTEDGLRALSKNKPIDPDGVERYLRGKFGDALDDTREAMRRLARALTPGRLAGEAYGLYENFRPEVPAGTKGWGAKGRLNLDKIREMGREAGH
ncbi:MAG: hypothetical protein GWO16_13480 [Gammaproteobacteria bacterium]|nr:hypothetical protein [Gammaproteobacteria bacterium]NIR31780.1 hypothetical protein [Gammaproteobacteria bacterium]NIR98711.1 hypothetical protein [Gammaproteobacteria bacterium]NIT64428.1 hypothetical protein [Gammaproteobacteria bacterium]NIV20843.1 hypothetical protein [Gammaproteobacteria bacterium]